MRLILLFLSLSSIIQAQSVIFNRDALPANGEIVTDTFLFFDVGKSTLRAGTMLGRNWSPDSIGHHSIALGAQTKAKGFGSVSIGFQNEAIGSGSLALGSNAKASMAYSIAIGNFASSTGTNSISLGDFTRASFNNSMAMGESTWANNYNAVAIGKNAVANGWNSFAIGHWNKSNGDFSFSIGNETQSSSFNEIALGSYNTIITPISSGGWVPEDRLLVVGNGRFEQFDEIRSDAMVIMKNGDVRFPDGSFLVGRDSMPKNGENINGNLMFYEDSIAAFRGGQLISSNVWSPDSLGKTSFAYGYNVKARGINSTAFGFRTEALGGSSFAIGNQTLAYGGSTFAAGQRSIASGNGSAVFGSFTMSRSWSEFAIGHYNTDYVPLGIFNINEKDRLFVIGNGTSENDRSDAMVLMKNGDVTFPDGSFSVGRDSMPKNGEVISENLIFYDNLKGTFRGGKLNNSANWSPDSTGIGSFGFGYNVLANDYYSTAFGASTKASGYISFASGQNSEASGEYSFASGLSSLASGDKSFASGGFTEANGEYAFSAGFGSQASGVYASSFGVYSKARGDMSFAAGLNSIAESYAEFVLGTNNTESVAIDPFDWNAADRLFVIGNGTSLNTRSDAMVMLKNGNTTINGDVKISDASDPELLFERSSLGSFDAKIRVGTTGHMYFDGGKDVADGLTTNMMLKSNGKLGIRTTNPDKELHVNGNVKIEGKTNDANLYMQSINGNENRVIVLQDNNDDVFFGDIDGENRDVIFRSNGADRIWLKNDGNIGIGNNAPSEKLSVNGNIIATGTINGSSDLRYKREITPISSSLSKVKQLNGYYYYWNQEQFPEKEFSENRQIGVIAQEVEALFPEMVLTDSEGYKSVAYSRLTPVLIEAVKELSEQNNRSKEEIDHLRSELSDIKSIVSALVEKAN